ncbi:type II pantothenate kinase [Sporolactobacillus laevolacticus]|uniref:type II pantothenate kinase n=1 Tax=Sporolactobacillus laevolacticus TaxID=33018 RepID=UPI0025B51F83|nr:type II pantothenate kinase [Sporolactobacillus laevolacticus]MDN3954342.1 type II pantothenate kinase [Sporolactobacillus laevolacticus]
MSIREKVGVDVGGTLIKAAIQTENDWIYQSFPISQIDDVAGWLTKHSDHRSLCLTGGKASLLQSKMSRSDIYFAPEFLASCNGARYLLTMQQTNTLTDFILTNVGTGTSMNLIKGETQQWIGGTGVGGGTIMGLSRLLTGIHDYDRLVELAASGRRDTVDLTVANIYEGETPPIPGDLTASNFGGLMGQPSTPSSADQLASVIGLVAETVASLSVFAAKNAHVDHAVYIGSSFVDNSQLSMIVESYSNYCGITPIILHHGQFCGAIGAALEV